MIEIKCLNSIFFTVKKLRGNSNVCSPLTLFSSLMEGKHGVFVHSIDFFFQNDNSCKICKRLMFNNNKKNYQ